MVEFFSALFGALFAFTVIWLKEKNHRINEEKFNLLECIYARKIRTILLSNQQTIPSK